MITFYYKTSSTIVNTWNYLKSKCNCEENNFNGIAAYTCDCVCMILNANLYD